MDSPTRLAYLQAKKDEYQKHKPRYLAKAKENSARRIWFKTKRVYVKDCPRTGICSLCRRKGLTHLHHIQYDENEPLAHTIEVCPSCHMKETWGDSK